MIDCFVPRNDVGGRIASFLAMTVRTVVFWANALRPYVKWLMFVAFCFIFIILFCSVLLSRHCDERSEEAIFVVERLLRRLCLPAMTRGKSIVKMTVKCFFPYRRLLDCKITGNNNAGIL
jgi:hypothetical protein